MQPQKLDVQLLSSIAATEAAAPRVVVTVRMAHPATDSQVGELTAEGLRARRGDRFASGALSAAQIEKLSDLPWVSSIRGTRELRAIER